MPTESPEEGASFAVVIADPPILSCKDRAGRALLSGCSTNERSAFFAVPPPFLGDEDSIGGSALCALVCSKKNRDGRGGDGGGGRPVGVKCPYHGRSDRSTTTNR